jgi:hypothetical protein
MKSYLASLALITGATLPLGAATITFKGSATSLEAKPLPAAVFVTLRARIVDDAGNVYNRVKIGRGDKDYIFTFDTTNLDTLEKKGLSITISADGRQDAIMARVLGVTADGKDATVNVNVALPELPPLSVYALPVVCYPPPCYDMLWPTYCSGSTWRRCR